VASAGAHVTIVGRSEVSGEGALTQLRQVQQRETLDDAGTVSFVQGDIGSVQKVSNLLDRLEEFVAQQGEGFDYLVVTAAVFPDWSGTSHQQEDGVDRPFFIAVVGRYMLYTNMERFMNTKKSSRVLNILASGEMPAYALSRDLASGQRNATSLFDSIITFGSANELMLHLVDPPGNTTIVSTHPGMLKTELHKGQGAFFDAIEAISVGLNGISI